MTVEVVEYDDAWPVRFSAEADQIRAALEGRLRRVEHVGSTAVPGLAARPIIDIAVSVEDLDAVDLGPLGYDEEGELPEGRAFAKPGFDLWAYELEPEGFLDHLRVRDYLRLHPEDRDDYAARKRLDEKEPYLELLVAMLRRG